MSRVPSQSFKVLRSAAVLSVLPIVLAVPVLAQTVSPVAPTPPTPAAVVTSTPALNNVGDGGCVQQYNGAFSTLSQNALTASAVGLGAQAVGAAADVTGLIAGEVAASAQGVSFGVMAGGLTAAAAGLAADVPVFGTAAGGAVGLGLAAGAAGALATASGVEAIALAAQIIGAGATVTGVGSSIAGQVFDQQTHDLTDYVVGTGTNGPNPGLPYCELTLTGTVTVQGGGVNVRGDSIFNDDVGVDGNVAVSNNVTANQVHASQGVSAHGGAIFLGNPDGVSFFQGITLGGGALAGAGTGGALAFTGDVSAIAIGNGARATSVNSLALGNGANATAVGATAIGENSLASGTGSIAIGNAMSTGVNTIAIGTGAVATDSVALGTQAQASGGGTSVGDFSSANGGVRGSAFGNGARAQGDQSVAVGTNSSAAFSNSAAYGSNAVAVRDNQQMFGTANNTYTMAGIASADSRNAQMGLLEVATTDASGNLATDGGAIFKALARVQAGVAVAMATTAPVLPTGKKFAMRIGWGGFDSYASEANAVGGSLVGIIGQSVLSPGDILSLDAGIGFGWSDFMGYKESAVVAGRAGMQLSW